MDPTKVFGSQAEAEAFEKWIRSTLEAEGGISEEEDADLKGKTEEELLAMLPDDLRAQLFPPKGWHRNTAAQRRASKLLKMQGRYLFKNTGNKAFARKAKDS